MNNNSNKKSQMGGNGGSRGLGTILVSMLAGLYLGMTLSRMYDCGSRLPGNDGWMKEHETQSLRQLLSKTQKEQTEWKSMVEKLQKDYTIAMDKIQTLEEEGRKSCSDDRTTSDNERHHHHHHQQQQQLHPHAVCQYLPTPTPTALSLWIQNINGILEATRLPQDLQFKFHDFTTQLLQIITPRLYRSIKTLPHEWDSVEHVMTVAWERYQYMQLSPEDRIKLGRPPPRPVKILVMGGSLLVGTNCRKVLTELGINNMRLPNRSCTWSSRLQGFLNSLFKSDVFEVTKVAMGGTNTETGNVIWKYDLIPEEARNPDIVINAYSTNDMHVLTILEAQSSNVTLRDKVFEMTQTFVRNVIQTCDPSQPPPLLLHVDDYLGNEQRTIWDTTELSQGVQVLANYYGFASLSYADVVREIVYGDTKEAWLSANWWETGTYDRQIHPGMGMHIASTWVVAYYLFNLMTTYCSLPPPPKDYQIQDYSTGYLGLPPLRSDIKQVQNKPQSHPKGLPPALTKELLIEDVSKLWEEAESHIVPSDSERLQSKDHHTKCPFSWVSGLSLQQNNQTWIQEYFERQSTTWVGWILGNDGGKLGFVPSTSTTTSSPKIVLDFVFPQTIRSVTFFFMKSYGEKWEGSQLKTSLQHLTEIDGTDQLSVLEERSLSGIHNKQTSEMYTEEIKLSQPVAVRSKLRIEAILSGGTMFKLMGLAICS